MWRVADVRNGVVDLGEARHRGGSLLEDVRHPAEGDHRPDQQAEISEERRESAYRDRTVDDLLPSEVDGDDERAADEHEHEGPHHRLDARENKVLFEIIEAESAEPCNLIRLAYVGFHDPDSREILLGPLREERELLLPVFKLSMDQF